MCVCTRINRLSTHNFNVHSWVFGEYGHVCSELTDPVLSALLKLKDRHCKDPYTQYWVRAHTQNKT